MSKINFIFCPTLWSNNSKTPLSHVLETHLCYLQLQALYSFSTFFFVKKAISISWNYVKTGHLKKRQKYIQISIKNIFKKVVYYTCILPDYMAHDITKEFWKNSHFENMTAGFLLRCQNSLR